MAAVAGSHRSVLASVAAWAAGGAVVLGALAFLGTRNYLIFHTLAELFSCVVVAAIFVIAWNTRYTLDNGYLLFLGIAWVFVAVIDLVHTLAFKGMCVLPGLSSNEPTQLWIAGRALEAISLVIAPAFLRRRVWPRVTALAYAAVVALVLLSIFWWRVFPACHVEDRGLTPFKVSVEYAICLLLTIALVGLLVHRRRFSRAVLVLLCCAVGVTILSELAFTLYQDVRGLFNMLGHLLKIVAFFLVYEAIVVTGLRRPFELLYRSLHDAKDRAEHMTDQLARSNKELAEFGYIVSHDLQEPLRTISGFIGLLRDRYDAQLDEKGRQYISHAVSGATRMSRLISDLLEYSRLGRQAPRLGPVDLRAVFDDAVANCSASIETTAASVGRDELPVVQGDRGQLVRLMQNLIGNALKFRRPDVQPEVHVSASRSDGGWVISVRDNGIGIAENQIGRLFQLFQRLHGRDRYEGTGIGLAECKKIVDLHGGRIWLESQVGVGTTVLFTLPQAGGNADHAAGA